MRRHLVKCLWVEEHLVALREKEIWIVLAVLCRRCIRLWISALVSHSSVIHDHWAGVLDWEEMWRVTLRRRYAITHSIQMIGLDSWILWHWLFLVCDCWMLLVRLIILLLLVRGCIEVVALLVLLSRIHALLLMLVLVILLVLILLLMLFITEILHIRWVKHVLT